MAAAPDLKPSPVTLDAATQPALPALFAAALGPVGAARYGPLFNRMEAGQVPALSWNWAAAGATLNWMIFRRLWLPAVLYAAALLILPLLLVGVGRPFLQWSGTTEVAALLGLLALTVVLPGALGDRLLYQHCRDDITRALGNTPTLEAACAELAKHAPGRVGFRRQLLANIVLGAVALAAYLTWLTAPASPTVPANDPPAVPIEPARPAQPLPSAPLSPTPVTPAPSASVTTPASAPASTPDAAHAPASASAPVTLMSVADSAPAGVHINVGLFADLDNARRAYVKLVKAGLPAQREVLDIKGQRVTRVRAGPFATRAKAQAAIAQIKALELDAVLAKP